MGRFIPQDRIRRIRREEDVARAQAKRVGLKSKDLTVQHWTCPCGSVECLGNVQLIQNGELVVHDGVTMNT